MDRITGDTIDLGGGRRGFRSKDTVAGVPGTVLRADYLNALQEELLALIETSGQAASSADLQQILRALRSQRGNWLAAGGTANAITLTPVPAFTWQASLVGVPLRFIVAITNTGAVTLNVNGLGAYQVTSTTGVVLAAGALPAGEIVEIIWNGASYCVTSIRNATGAATAAWADITGRPTAFPPSAHTHDAADLVSGIVPEGRMMTRLARSGLNTSNWGVMPLAGYVWSGRAVDGALGTPDGAGGTTFWYGHCQPLSESHSIVTVIAAFSGATAPMWRQEYIAGAPQGWVRVHQTEAALDARYKRLGAGGWTLLHSTSISSGGATITDINQQFDDIMVMISLSGAGTIGLRLSGDAGSSPSWPSVHARHTAAGGLGSVVWDMGAQAGGITPRAPVRIPGYRSAMPFKSAMTHTDAASLDGTGYIWFSASAIRAVGIIPLSAGFTSGTMEVWGI